MFSYLTKFQIVLLIITIILLSYTYRQILINKCLLEIVLQFWLNSYFIFIVVNNLYGQKCQRCERKKRSQTPPRVERAHKLSCFCTFILFIKQKNQIQRNLYLFNKLQNTNKLQDSLWQDASYLIVLFSINL